ncbi:hypothetical protein SDC9_80335 [bioreactor metagenome]|uniref:Uncharacterized protein n=1 Tax=bioreactor metagenome TaxID=1076179 RepID=A0A644YZH0_9ZZZZ
MALELLVVGKIHPLIKIHGGMIPVPGIVAAHIRVQRVVPGLFQQRCDPESLRHIPTDFRELLAGKRALSPALHKALCGVTHDHREILPAGPLDPLHNLHRHADAVFKTSAVLIGAPVAAFHGELIDQVPLVHGVDFHAVKTGVLGDESGSAHRPDNGLNFLGGNCPADDIRLPAVRDLGRGNGEGPGWDAVGHPAESGGYLKKYFRSVSMYPFGELFGRPFEQNGIKGGTGHRSRCMTLHRVFRITHSGNEQSHAALCAFNIEVDAALGKGTLGVCQSSRAHGRHNEAVLYR